MRRDSQSTGGKKDGATSRVPGRKAGGKRKARVQSGVTNSSPTKVTVQGTDGRFYEVNLRGLSCSCYEYRQVKTCPHLRYATNVYGKCGSYYRFTGISALHKEVRRSDIERGTMCARMYARISGVKSVVNYLSGILFEESRSLDLYRKIKRRELNEQDLARSIFRVRKKWELQYFSDHMTWWNGGFTQYFANRDEWDNDGLDRMSRIILNADNPTDLYEMLLFLKYNKEYDPLFWAKISERAARDKNEILLGYLQLQPEASYYCRMVAAELAMGLWDKEADEFRSDLNIDRNYLPAFRPYVFSDSHTWAGRRGFVKNFYKLKPGIDIPVDLRFAGHLLGNLWRFACYSQCGYLTSPTGEDVPWKAVAIDNTSWEETVKHDSAVWYRRVYSEIRGFNPSGDSA